MGTGQFGDFVFVGLIFSVLISGFVGDEAGWVFSFGFSVVRPNGC
jgi:hypothetical protein